MAKKIRGYIDVEPKWSAIQRMVERGIASADMLRPASNLAEKVREIQKSGKIAIIYPDGRVKSVKKLKEVV